jgi:hypothetical protein
MSDLDHYRYKAEGTLNGEKFTAEGEVYASHSWEAAELAEAEVRANYPGVILKDDEPERGVTSSPQVFVTRDIVNRAVARGQRCPATGNLLPEPIPDDFVTGPKKPTEIKPTYPPPLP